MGFGDTRGTLFFEIAEILRIHRPKAFFLENVRHLHRHDNGRTYSTIQRVLTEDLGYTLQDFIVKASDHGLPQIRPRLFMIGFRDTNLSISQPEKKPLAFTMSDVLGGTVSREIGYTLRVGGKGSGVNDRRNWDSYILDGQEVRIGPEEALKMQGFPDWFEFPVSTTQAMKQLGNSVAVWAIRDYAFELVRALQQPRAKN
jgi:DNA (cytosine-5)-methyltransferase 1